MTRSAATSATPVLSPSLAWKRQVDGADKFVENLSTASGLVFCSCRGGDKSLFNQSGYALCALSLADGSQVWKVDYPSRDATPLVAGDAVFVRSPKLSLTGFGDEVRALSTKDGHVLWKGGWIPGDTSCNEFTLTSGILVIGTGPYGQSLGCGIYALHAETGKKAWQVKLPKALYSHEPLLFRSDGRDTLVCLENDELAKDPLLRNRLVCRDPLKGDVLWEHSFPKAPFFPILSDEKRIYGLTFELVAVDGKTGEVQWHLAKGDGNPIAMGGGHRLIVFGETEDAKARVLRAIDADSGKVLWTSPSFPADEMWDSSPRQRIAIASNVIYFAEGASVVARAIEDGKELWRWKLESGEAINVITVDNTVIVGATDGCLYVLRHSGR